MIGYDFKKFFKERQIANNEYACNGHFIINRNVLTKSQNRFIDTFQESTLIENMVKVFKDIEAKHYYLNDIFVPLKVTEIYETNENYPVVIDENNVAIKAEYYNFIQSIKCRLFSVQGNAITPCHIYNEYSELVGIVLPVRIKPEDIQKASNYDEYVELQKSKYEEQQQAKENMKKCLYISDNKAVVRNKELTCVADLVNDQVYNRLYVESNYKKDGGMVFIDFGFILMYVKHLSHYDVEPKDIIYSLERVHSLTFEDYKKYITDCVNNMQFINVAEIKLMELSGESPEYIKLLTEHRQKYINIKDEQHRQKEIEREVKEKAYVEEQNSNTEKIIQEAEQKILNHKEVKNQDITFYKSQYDSHTTSLILHLMKKYNIKVPMKTQGWINQALSVVCFNEDSIGYRYYTSSKDSTVFYQYLQKLYNTIIQKELVK